MIEEVPVGLDVPDAAEHQEREHRDDDAMLVDVDDRQPLRRHFDAGGRPADAGRDRLELLLLQPFALHGRERGGERREVAIACLPLEFGATASRGELGGARPVDPGLRLELRRGGRQRHGRQQRQRCACATRSATARRRQRRLPRGLQPGEPERRALGRRRCDAPTPIGAHYDEDHRRVPEEHRREGEGAPAFAIPRHPVVGPSA